MPHVMEIGIQLHRRRADTQWEMARFSTRRVPAPQFLKVACDQQDAGYRLAVSYPDGSQRVERFDDARSLLEGTTWLQDELIRDGWEPCQQPLSQESPSFFVRFDRVPKTNRL